MSDADRFDAIGVEGGCLALEHRVDACLKQLLHDPDVTHELDERPLLGHPAALERQVVESRGQPPDIAGKLPEPRNQLTARSILIVGHG